MLSDELYVEELCIAGTSHYCGDNLGYMNANIHRTMRNQAFDE